MVCDSVQHNANDASRAHDGRGEQRHSNTHNSNVLVFMTLSDHLFRRDGEYFWLNPGQRQRRSRSAGTRAARSDLQARHLGGMERQGGRVGHHASIAHFDEREA